MDWKAKTIETYDNSSAELADYFRGIGSRVKDIELGLKLAPQNKEIKAVEIGCGDGRDAEEIIKRVGWYEGYDPSEGLLRIARQKLPTAHFVKADTLTYNYPKDLGLVFAFASLLHVNKDDLKTSIAIVGDSLGPGGIFYITLKENAEYVQEVKHDQYGERMFYYYNPGLIKELAGNAFKSVEEDHQKIGKTDWFTIALQRI